MGTCSITTELCYSICLVSCTISYAFWNNSTLNKTFEMLLSIISVDCFLECDCVLGDLWLPLSPWSLYNSNCVQICMSSTCHFPRSNLLYAHCDLGETDSYSKPVIIHPTHTVSCLSLYLHTSKILRHSDWQHVTAKHKFLMYLRVWMAQILTEIYLGYDALSSLWRGCFSISKSNSLRKLVNAQIWIVKIILFASSETIMSKALWSGYDTQITLHNGN